VHAASLGGDEMSDVTAVNLRPVWDWGRLVLVLVLVLLLITLLNER
jgi:hypothetical protein